MLGEGLIYKGQMAVLDDFGLRVEERVQKLGKHKAEGSEEICKEQGSSAT